MRTIKIQEIKNGFILEVFKSYPSPDKLDYTIYRETFKEVLEELRRWYKKTE